MGSDSLPTAQAKPAFIDRPSSRVRQVLVLLDRPAVLYAALVAVLIVAALFRLNNIAWDSGKTQHPDERFLFSVTNDLHWPESFDTYFDPAASTLSPYSLPNMGLYVYGMLPVYLVKWVAIVLDRNNYDALQPIGRVASALFDVCSILFLFLIGKRLYGAKVGLLAALLLSLSVLNIQLSHFYTVDTFANLFVVATLYMVLRASASGRWPDYALAGVLLGLGLSSKISVATLGVPIVLGAVLDLRRRLLAGDQVEQATEQVVVRLISLVAIAVLLFRILQPIAFAGPGFWNWSLNPAWQDDIAEQSRIVSGESDLPWLQQWTNRPPTFALYNILVWGLGLPFGLAAMAGVVLAAYELVRWRRLEHLLPLAYVLVTFTYHAFTFVKFMRYFLPIYPFLALFAAYGLSWIWRVARSERAFDTLRRWRWLNPKRLVGAASALTAVVVGGTFVYALAFSSIYSRTHTRVEATRWMFANLPEGSVLANEHWDDWLPIGGLDGRAAYGDNGIYRSVEMPNYEDDTPEKVDRLVENLAQADYVILSSNRLYDSIPRLPMRYPMTIRYYQLLFSGQLGFERIKEFSSYPSLFGIQISDQSAEEAFSVYDHPRVQIFKKTASFDRERVRQLLNEGINWNAVVHLSPRQASAAPSVLRLNAAEQQQYRQVAAWSSAGVNAGSWGGQAPLVAWALAIELLGLLALPFTLRTFGRMVDRGYMFSKALGLLLAGWGAWMLASLRTAPFSGLTIVAVLILLAISSAWLLYRRRRELHDFVSERAGLLLFEESLFWLLFAMALSVRWFNPDLWHPGLGGEKPMDVAYLTAVVRTPYFPAYDPWFAGGYMNYYYFGFVLVATLIHITGIMPTIAYNLAVPTFFAFTAGGAFSAALNLSSGRNDAPLAHWFGVRRSAIVAGCAGALFVTVLGNLGQAQLLWDGIRALSAIDGASGGWWTPLAQFADGFAKWRDGASLNFRTEWWYWNATRIIPPGKDEVGPINEMPFFTFLFADLHAHMLALPYTMLALGLGINLVRGEHETPPIAWWRDGGELLTLALAALVMGALWPMNTWDVPTYTAVIFAALACREHARRNGTTPQSLWAAAWRLGLILAAGRLLFWPFHQHYATAYFGAERWQGSQTPLWAYLLIHGFFLFVLVSYLLLELLRGGGHNALARSARLSLVYWRRRDRLQRLRERLVHPTHRYWLATLVVQGMTLLIAVLLAMRPVVGIALAFAMLALVLALDRKPAPRRQFALCLIGLGFALTGVVELVVLKGDISRMNTVFKTYLQVWVIWGVAAAAVLPWCAAELRRGWRRALIGRAAHSERYVAWRRSALRWAWWAVFGVLAGLCALYPLTATPVRIGDRFPDSNSIGLDGTAYMRTAVYNDDGTEIPLDADKQAIEWLQYNVAPLTPILEANTPLYRWGSRISIYTGLPTVIGWDWHQKQQRSILPGELIDRRLEDVRTIYTTGDEQLAHDMLQRYGVGYVYVGPLERKYYPPEGLDKFERAAGRLWDVVFRSDRVTIYKMR